MFKLNDNNIFIGEIKQILREFNLPNCNIYKEGENLIPNTHYIKGNGFYFCNSNGELELISSYVYGSFLPNITSNLKMSNNIYDRYTHRYLGKYLRFLRDYCNLNLMSMYNCFDGEILPTLRITDLDKSEEDEESEEDTTPKHRFTVDDKNYVFYKVPVISNKVYTMATDCALTIEMFCGYDIKSTIEPIKETYNKVNSCSFNIPFIYEIGNYDNSQNNLCIILKVPMSLKSSIVILEGDYSSSC